MDEQNKARQANNVLVNNLVDLIEEGNAHVSLEKALSGIPYSLLGEKPGGLPYSIWQLTEHIRIAQWDILEFSRNAQHESPEWPAGYWPKENSPESQAAWQNCFNAIQADRSAFTGLIKNAGQDLERPFEHGTGQSILKEALVLADHNSYHTAEIIIIRRLLGIWNNK